MLLKGTHGTCVTFANRIEAEGFNAQARGRGGAGVYFWGYRDDGYEWAAKELAEGWWHFAKAQRRYAAAADQACAILYVKLHVDDKRFLDLENLEIKERFIQFANKVFRRVRKPRGKEISGVYDLFVALVEKELGVQIQVIHVRVAPPSKDYYKAKLPMEITGAPSCYVVKNVECIEIDRIERN